jgi:hypothetical protein
MANFFTSIGKAILNFFTSGRAKRDGELALKYAGEAIPYLAMASQIVVGATKTEVDDEKLKEIKADYPRLFDGSILTPAELKGYALQVAGAFLRQKFPKLDTTVSVLAAQLAYTEARGNGSVTSVA